MMSKLESGEMALRGKNVAPSLRTRSYPIMLVRRHPYHKKIGFHDFKALITIYFLLPPHQYSQQKSMDLIIEVL